MEDYLKHLSESFRSSTSTVGYLVILAVLIALLAFLYTTYFISRHRRYTRLRDELAELCKINGLDSGETRIFLKIALRSENPYYLFVQKDRFIKKCNEANLEDETVRRIALKLYSESEL